MKKLNNEGWGLVVMLAFMGVFFLAILIIAILSSKYGLLTSEKPKVNSNETLITTEQEYAQYEQIIELSAVDYVKKHNNDIENEDIININNLKIDTKINQQCDGYIKIIKENNNTSSKAYIKCSNYQTQGYIEAYNQ